MAERATAAVPIGGGQGGGLHAQAPRPTGTSPTVQLSSSPNWAAKADTPERGLGDAGDAEATDAADQGRPAVSEQGDRPRGDSSGADHSVVFGFAAPSPQRSALTQSLERSEMGENAATPGADLLRPRSPRRAAQSAGLPRKQPAKLSDSRLAEMRLDDATHYAHLFRTLHEEPDVDVGIALIDRALDAFRYSLWELTGDVEFSPRVHALGHEESADESSSPLDRGDASALATSNRLEANQGELLRTFLGQIARLAYACPVAEYAERFRMFFEEVRQGRAFSKLPKRAPRPARFLPRSLFVPLTDADVKYGSRSFPLPTNSLTESADFGFMGESTDSLGLDELPEKSQKRHSDARQILYDVYLTVGRVSQLNRVIAVHPRYFEINFAAWSYLMTDESLPLPRTWRAFLICLTAARFNCLPVVDVGESDFLAAGGDPSWLTVPVCDESSPVPRKLRNFMELVQLLCHQPWLIRSHHISAICVVSDPPEHGDDPQAEYDGSVPVIATESPADLWTVSEVVQGITIIATTKALCGTAHAFSVVAESDFDWERHLARRKRKQAKERKSSNPIPAAIFTGLTTEDDMKTSGDEFAGFNPRTSDDTDRILQLLRGGNSEGDNGSDTDDVIFTHEDDETDADATSNSLQHRRYLSHDGDQGEDGLFAAMRLRGNYDWDSEDANENDGTPRTEQESLFANLEATRESEAEPDPQQDVHEPVEASEDSTASEEHTPLFVSGRPAKSLDRYCARHIFRMRTKDFNFKKFKPFRVHMYNWKDDGYALVSRFLTTTMAGLLDDEFDCIRSLTYKQFGRSKVATKTKRFREAIWQYSQYVKGMFHDDYDYKEVNQFLPIPLKKFLKKSICTPELIVESELDFDLDLGLDEKLHIALLAVQSARQSEILYGVHAVMRYLL